jgi:hypothetical protein
MVDRKSMGIDGAATGALSLGVYGSVRIRRASGCG